MVTYVINTATNDTTGMSPFFIHFGRHPKALPDPNITTSVPATDEFLDTLLAIQYMASKTSSILVNHKRFMLTRGDVPVQNTTQAQLALLNMKNIKQKTSTHSKLQSLWEGSFKVLVYWPSTDNIKLKLPSD